MKDLERMGAREWRDEARAIRPRRVGKTMLAKIRKIMSEGDAGPYEEKQGGKVRKKNK